MKRRDLLKIGLGAGLLAACGQTAPPTLEAKPATAPAAAPTAAPAAPAATKPAPPVAAAAPAPASKRGGTLRDAELADGNTIHPYKATDAGSAAYAGQVHGLSLADRDPSTLDFKPLAAKSWTVADDKVTYTFTLREDLKFSDGHPLTAEDYAWTFQQIAKPQNKYPYRSQLDQIASYSAPDAKTIVVKVKEPIAPGLERAIAAVSYPLPNHVWEKLDWNDPAKNPEILKPTVGSAEWKLVEWARDDHITFAPNEAFFKGRPNFDSYVSRVVPNRSVQLQMFKSGEIDLFTPQPSDYRETKALANAEMYEWQPAAPPWTYMAFNFRREHVSDVRVRRALSYAIDRQGIIDAVVEGLGKPIYSTFPPTHWVYNPNVEKYDYSLDKARQLLKDAGYASGPDGILQKGGKPLKLKLLFGPATNKVREQIATIAQQAYKDIGVQLDVTGMEFNAFLAAIKDEKTEWDMNVLGWTGTLEPDAMRSIWLESSIPDLNAGAYRNKKVEELFVQGQREFDREKRKAIYGEIQRIIAEDAPYVFLYYGLGYTSVSKRIGGVKATPLGITADEGILDWYVRQT